MWLLREVSPTSQLASSPSCTPPPVGLLCEVSFCLAYTRNHSASEIVKCANPVFCAKRVSSKAQIGSSNSYPKDGHLAGEDLQRSTVRETKSPRPSTTHLKKAKPRHRLATAAGAKAMTEVKRGSGSVLRMVRQKGGRGCVGREGEVASEDGFPF
ncbi:hypothetical protein ACLB2K_029873 [Fragaria x ananassa]